MSRPVRTPVSKSALRAAGLLAVLAAGGCGSSSATQSTPTTSTVAAKPATRPARHHATPAKPAAASHPVSATPTSTASINPPAAAAKPAPQAAAPVPVPIPAPRAKLGTPRTWSGSGDRTLGTIALPRSVVVHWTVSGPRFAVVDASGKLAISGMGATGASFVAAGTYSGVKVTASGRWTLSMASLGA